MQIQNKMLDRCIQLETFGEVLEVLTPKQLAAVALILDEPDYSVCRAALSVGLVHQHYHARLAYARRRILETYPELAPRVASRKRRKSPRA